MNEKFRCPKCDARIRLRTTFAGWDCEDVDPETGETDEEGDVESERTEIHEVRFECSECEWEGPEWAFEEENGK